LVVVTVRKVVWISLLRTICWSLETSADVVATKKQEMDTASVDMMIRLRKLMTMLDGKNDREVTS